VHEFQVLLSLHLYRCTAVLMYCSTALHTVRLCSSRRACRHPYPPYPTHPPAVRDPVTQALVHTRAHALGELPVVEGARVGARLDDHLVHRGVDGIRRDAGAHQGARVLQHLRGELAGGAHFGDALWVCAVGGLRWMVAAAALGQRLRCRCSAQLDLRAALHSDGVAAAAQL